MTVNGFGTLHYGWKTLSDGTALATCWIVAAFLPVVPLWRARIQVHPLGTQGSSQVHPVDPGTPWWPVPSGFHASWTIIEYLPLNWLSVLTTYFKAYVIFPFIVGLPIGAVTTGLFHWFGSADRVPVRVYFSLYLGSMIYCGAVVAYILDGTAGRRAIREDVTRRPRLGSEEWLAKYIGTTSTRDQVGVLAITPLALGMLSLWLGSPPLNWIVAAWIVIAAACAGLVGGVLKRHGGGIRTALFWFDLVTVTIYVVMAPVMFLPR